jgi:sensor histidine kinase YesM
VTYLIKYWKDTVGQLLFWALSFVVLMLVFNESGSINTIDFVYTTIFHFTLVPLVYLNYYFGVPGLFLRQKYLAYFVLILPALVLFSLANLMLFDHYADVIFPGYYFVSGFVFRDVVIVHFLYLLISTLVLLSGSWFRQTENEKKLLELEGENVRSELQMLKNQVNPHFFFNTLQNLYALSLKKSDKLPEMILKLSDLMRYVIYDSNIPKIMATKEIEFIHDYLELQKLRLSPDTKLTFEVLGEPGNAMLPPLLLIPFVENCFKHGLKGEVKNAFATICLEFDKKQMLFIARNNTGLSAQSKIKKGPGVGIENVKRRLDLNYPERYFLKITDEDSIYEVCLKINLS